MALYMGDRICQNEEANRGKSVSPMTQETSALRQEKFTSIEGKLTRVTTLDQVSRNNRRTRFTTAVKERTS